MDLQELEKYRPIPWEGVRLLAWVALAALVALGGAFFLGMIFPEASLSLEFWKGWMILFVIALTVLFRLGARRINGYWERKVRGFNGWYWRDDEEEIQFAVTRRGKKGDKNPSSLKRPAIKVPLGGWFRREGRVVASDSAVNNRLVGWSVQCLSLLQNGEGMAIRLIYRFEGSEERIDTTISKALSSLEFVARGELRYLGLSALVSHLCETRRVAERERDEAREEASRLRGALGEAETEREFALNAMHNAIVAIGKTSRFGKSKEAKRIREELTSGLLAALPFYDHPLKRIYGRPDGQFTAPAAAEAREGG